MWLEFFSSLKRYKYLHITLSHNVFGSIWTVMISLHHYNYFFVFSSAAFMLSASFHSGSRGGGFVGPRRRPAAEELLQQFNRPPPALPAHMKLDSLSFKYALNWIQRMAKSFHQYHWYQNHKIHNKLKCISVDLAYKHPWAFACSVFFYRKFHPLLHVFPNVQYYQQKAIIFILQERWKRPIVDDNGVSLWKTRWHGCLP